MANEICFYFSSAQYSIGNPYSFLDDIWPNQKGKKLMSTDLTENFLLFFNMSEAGANNPHRPSFFSLLSPQFSVAPAVYHVQLAICHTGIITQKKRSPVHHNPSASLLSMLTNNNQTPLFSAAAAVRI